jgi:signal transduction histidine kinase
VAGPRIDELCNQVSELGADLHSLSHRLHSSTLESLGLVAGIKAFCREFATQQEIDVRFSHELVPQDLSDDVSLCLFRIVQEGLRNVKRHSGSSGAEVSLATLNGQLHLSVTDNGRGFDVKRRSPESGIGLHSMEERLRPLGGKLEIHSRPGEGTRIDAWVQIRARDQHVG